MKDHVSCYLRSGIVYIPAIAKVSDGGSIEIDPVEKVYVSDTPKLIAAFRNAMKRLAPTIPPQRRSADSHPVLKHANLKTWQSFERGAKTWSIYRIDDYYTIYAWKKVRGTGWLADSERNIRLPEGTSAEAACERLADVVRSAAQADERP